MGRSISTGKASRSRERHLNKKFYAYDEKKRTNRENKIRQKEFQEEIKIQSYFKPKVSETSRALAKKKRLQQDVIHSELNSKKETDQNQNSTIEFSATDTIFDRLHKEGRIRKEELERIRKSQNKSEYALPRSNMVSFYQENNSKSNSKKKCITNPSFHMLSKVSPLTSVEQLYPLSPRVNEGNNRYIMDKYMTKSFKAQGKLK